MERKITDDMDLYKICDTLGEGSSISSEIVYDLFCIDDIKGWQIWEQIKSLDRMGIRGDKIRKLWEYCSDKNINKLYLTILALRFDIYTADEISSNLKFKKPVPFIRDEDVKMEYLESLNRMLFYEKVRENKVDVLKNMSLKKRKRVRRD